MKMTGIIFSNIYDSYLGELTRNRTIASLPFGGRYRLIDFVLSNMSNSGIVEVGIITKYNYQSLMDHLGSCEEWDLNRKNGHVFILPPYGTGQTGVYKGKLEALAGARVFIERTNAKHILLCDSNVICNIDYGVVLKHHVQSGADITMIGYRPGAHPENQLAKFVMRQHADGDVTDIVLNTIYAPNDLCGMGMFIVNYDVLLQEVTQAVSHGRFYLERDFIQKRFIDGTLSVNAYEFKRTVLMTHDVTSYFKNNLKLLEEQVRQGIFSQGSPIYTKVRDEAPTWYGDDAAAGHSLIADGCKIEGTVLDSVLFRNVFVQKGAHVENSVIMQGSVICAGAVLRNVILDKNVEITEGQTLIGSPDIPMIVQKGYKV